jgi:putative hydrolase of the HAD superfamily
VITTLLLDIGGVLLTNGWDGPTRKLAAESFELDYTEMDKRHRLVFDTFETGKLTLDQYLQILVFYQPRPFTIEQFRDFMFAQSKPLPHMIDFLTKLKEQYHLKIGALSNEGRELAEYRNKQLGLTKFIDFFIVSGFVHLRKPDPDIYRLALDVGQALPEEVIYIDDRAILTEIGASLGLNVIHHTGYETTKAALFNILNTNLGN